MKPRLSAKREAGMTLFEVGVVVAVGLLVLALLLPTLHDGPPVNRATRINCVNNLKQVGLAYRVWAGDNGDFYPMGISLTNGGSMELAQTGNVPFTFEVMSNELSTPKILYCPADSSRFWSKTFTGLANSNMSYFLGVDVTNDVDPQAFLSGDCNFAIGGKAVKSGLLPLWTNDPVVWSAGRHIHTGNIGFADGSVNTATTLGLRSYLANTGTATNRLAIP
jgi:prepilin-type processing-associated H-X9-DG protein